MEKFLRICAIIGLFVTATYADTNSGNPIDKGGAAYSSQFVSAQPADNSNLSLHLDYITGENIASMVQSVFTPQAGYEFEFIVGTGDISDGSDFGAVRNAFNTWVNLPDSALSITETTYDHTITLGSANGQNEISWIPYTGTNWWVDVLKYSPSTIGVAVTWYDQISGVVTERDVHFNDTYMYWYTDSDGASAANNPFYVEHIALHEEGHIFGLTDVYNPGQSGYQSWMGSDNANLTMYGYAASLNEDVTLTDVDIAAMALAHPVPEPATLCLLGAGIFALLRKKSV